MQGTVIVVTCEYAPFPGGIGTYATELVKALVAGGHRAIVVAPRYDDLSGPLPQGAEHHLLLGHHRLPGSSLPKLLRLLREAPSDAIVLAADIRTVLLLRLLRPLHRRAYRVMVHGSEASKFRAGSLMYRFVRRAYLDAELVAYNSRATRDILRASMGEPRREAITYLGVDRDWFDDPASERFDDPVLADLPPDAPLFCSVGRLEARKGQVETVRALALARDRHGLADPIYAVVGRVEDDAYAASIDGEAQALGVRTIRTGRLSSDDIKRLYRRATAHVLFARALPGKIEGFGLVLLEAAAQGCPSIASTAGGIPEVLDDTGTLVPDNDIPALATQLAAYATNPRRRHTEGSACRTRAAAFTWERCAHDTFPDLYQARVMS